MTRTSAAVETATGLRLSQIPLVREMLGDKALRIVVRPVDARWIYDGSVPKSIVGWHPFRPEIRLARHSALAAWLEAPDTVDERGLNESDLLVSEVLFAVHDYLHVWGTRAVLAAIPASAWRTSEERELLGRMHAMRSSLSRQSPLVLCLLLACTAEREVPAQSNPPASERPRDRPTAVVEDRGSTAREADLDTKHSAGGADHEKRAASRAGRSHDLRRAALVDLLTRRLAVES